MAAKTADEILARDGRMASEKSSYNSLCQEVAELMLPRQADFVGSDFNAQFPATRERTQNIIDETATQALDHGVTVFEGEVIPPGSQWQVAEPRDEELLKSQAARLWFEKKTNQLFALRNDPASGWAVATHESIASLLGFGMQSTFAEIRRDPAGRPLGIAYGAEHMGRIRVQENFQGFVDTIHYDLWLSHRQALQKWGDKAPECARKAERDRKNLDDRAQYLHVIEPNRDYSPQRIDAGGMYYSSCYVSISDKQVFDEGGYRALPRIVSRYEKSPTETYGRGPAFNVLPAVRACQEMMADLVTAIEFMARPALGAHDDLLDQILNYSPGGVTYGAIDARGQKLIQQLFESADIGPALQLLQETRGAIRRAFFEDLYSIRQEQKTHVAAADVMDRAQQRGLLLAPLQRQETEWFTVLTAREFDLMGQLGLLDDMPPEVQEAGGVYQLRYENPLSRARKAEAAAGFYQLMNGLSPLIQADPQSTIPELFRAYPFQKVMNGLAAIHGVPASWESTEQEKQAFDAARAGAIDKASALEIGDKAAGIAEKLSRAGGAAAGQGGGM
jgi:hypothetical protein